MSAPWFRLDYEGAQPIGEDIGFCRRARPLIADAIFNDDWLTTQLAHIGATAHRLNSLRPIDTATPRPQC
jgi:hypothetical protein